MTTMPNSQSVRQKLPHFDRPDYERVVITGMGAITPIGNDLDSLWDSLMAGKSGIDVIDDFADIDGDMSEFLVFR